MIKKTYTKDGKTCKVTFSLPVDVNADAATLFGDFTGWEKTPRPMKRAKDGSFSITVRLEPGRHYHFRYLLDNQRWENDWAADDYVRNIYGTDDSIVKV